MTIAIPPTKGSPVSVIAARSQEPPFCRLVELPFNGPSAWAVVLVV